MCKSLFQYCNRLATTVAFLCLAAAPLPAEDPYFVAYSHRMEEPGNLELALNYVTASPQSGNLFQSSLLEVEYGVKAWWTSELYLAGQGTLGQGALFTGYRFENRVRPLAREHWINPVLYVEYESLNAADLSLKEVVGHDSFRDQIVPLAEARREHLHELETKLILSSNVRGWNISGNLIGEKNLAHQPWEFGYALGVSRPLALAARLQACRLCAENFRAGLELYGGLGDWRTPGLHDTSHYLAPVLAWELPGGATMQVSPSFGLNGNSDRWLMRFTVAYEVSQFGRKMAAMFRNRSGPPEDPPAARPEPAAAGRKLFQRHCAACHGQDAQGVGRVPSLRSPQVRHLPPDVLFSTLTNGVLWHGMPSWSHLPEQRRWQIIAYLKTLE